MDSKKVKVSWLLVSGYFFGSLFLVNYHQKFMIVHNNIFPFLFLGVLIFMCPLRIHKLSC
jgi:hypothetical protein